MNLIELTWTLVTHTADGWIFSDVGNFSLTWFSQVNRRPGNVSFIKVVGFKVSSAKKGQQ